MTAKSVRRLLLIEDNPGDARLLREMLNEHGTRTIELRDGWLTMDTAAPAANTVEAKA